MLMIQRLIAIIIWGVMITALPACASGKTADVAGVKVAGPESLKVVCGDVLIRIDGPKMWTPSRIEYKGTLLGIEDSAYGTVLNFPDIGFLGTAHKLDIPDGQEDVRSLEFYLDGRRLAMPQDEISGKSFKLIKKSRILNVFIENITELRNNRIYETAIMKAPQETPLKVAYHFMHAWTQTATAFLACAADGSELQDELKDSNDVKGKHYVVRDLAWIAVYDGPSGRGIVSRLLEKPAIGGASSLLVNAPAVYRKCYVMCFEDKPLPAGFEGKYRMVTAFFEAKPNEWQDAARKLSQDMKKTKIIKNKK
ncbi:MAG: hypothetical protein ACYC54_13715 [Sedimentisphaerales bacterium]